MSDGRTYSDRDHGWHLGLGGCLVEADPELIRPMRSLRVDVSQEASVDVGTQWWEGLPPTGGGGMVVKPFANLVRGAKGLWLQPGIKARGCEYLRIIYGPDYTEPGN
ncbi:hypothetical protein [Arthrobacter livingstonensis]|uniref:hypothetical protein n=1 Tax=Arthrobacter livingstonensis TaxID=670078 RepID=UPI002482C1B3|nr:hypothetical protein [Arthrobacter livingstonensis]